MATTLDYDSARTLLDETFASAETDLLQRRSPAIPEEILAAVDTVFRSRTQAYREVLLGCTVARIQDKTLNIRLPYVELGPNAFSGRSLDERVINPFLHDKRIPCSRGPYLSVFRRSVRFDTSIRRGLKDKNGYDAFLEAIEYLESVPDNEELLQFLHFLLYKFAELREAAMVPLSRLQRMSLEQYETLISGLLATPSGGRFPVLLVTAALTMLKEHFQQDWSIVSQGINVADASSGVGGDIVVTRDNRILLAAEVTERVVDRSRVVATFMTKIAPADIEDYLFFVRPSGLTPEAQQQAQQYFAQGHEVIFVEIKEWILMLLATVGKTGRSRFNRILVEALDASDVPRTLKVHWNQQIARITGS